MVKHDGVCWSATGGALAGVVQRMWGQEGRGDAEGGVGHSVAHQAEGGSGDDRGEGEEAGHLRFEQAREFEFKDPRTWKYGERKCIVPVDVTIKYGYDLRDLTIDDVKLTDDSTAVVILLPEPKVIDSGYEAKVEEGAVVRMSSGLRDRISHEEVDQLMEQAYRAVMKEDFSEMVNRDIENNAKVVFEAIVKGIGLKNVEVIVVSKLKGEN